MTKLRHEIDVKNNVMGKQDELQKKSTVYSTQKINELNEMVLNGAKPDTTPFFTGRPEWRDTGIIFEYTDEELEEMDKCSINCEYFVSSYCKFLNKNGRTLVNLRDYQKRILGVMSAEEWDPDEETVVPIHPQIVMMQSRQTGKCLVINSTCKIDINHADKILSDNNKKYNIFKYIFKKLTNFYGK